MDALMNEPSEDPTIYEVIRDDHEDVSDLLEDLANEEDAERRAELFEELRDELERHARAEEAVFYDVLLQREDTKGMAREAIREHAEIRRLLAELDDISERADDRWDSTLEALAAAVRKHVENEENGIFAAVEGILDIDQARTLAETFEAMELRVEPEDEDREPEAAA